MKKKISVGSILVYLFLSIWAFTTIYPIIWVIQNSFKAKDKILADSFSLPVGDLFTTANYRKAFGNLNIFGAYRNSIFISMMVSLLVILLADVADHCYVSQWHLSKLLNKHTGENFSVALNKARIAEAKELLQDPSRRIYDIAEEVGFQDLAHFSRVFKKLEGISANEYRNTLS